MAKARAFKTIQEARKWAEEESNAPSKTKIYRLTHAGGVSYIPAINVPTAMYHAAIVAGLDLTFVESPSSLRQDLQAALEGYSPSEQAEIIDEAIKRRKKRG